ncbi:DHH family phosphoesterase, partial [Eubacterium callanderi]|uniref:DHH family phosphoesterase n=1 Tax=Eubacterium callanderi TaxID=53442 RepID=UPI0034E3A5EE|nr:bifunctional oligoribonuclease/PAP phosphatase NrnA [Eubacterium callanderi]
YFEDELQDEYDVVAFLVCSTMEYAFKPVPMVDARTTVVIVHHATNQGYGDINFLEITAATAELVFRILGALGVELDPEMVEAVFTGISTDTGRFQFSNVTADTHQILSRLYDKR